MEDHEKLEILLNKINKLENELSELKKSSTTLNTPSKSLKLSVKSPYSKAKSYEDLLDTFEDNVSTPYKTSKSDKPAKLPHHLRDIFISLTSWRSRASVSSYIYCKLKLYNIPLTMLRFEQFSCHTVFLVVDMILYMMTFLPLRCFYVVCVRIPDFIVHSFYDYYKMLFSRFSKNHNISDSSNNNKKVSKKATINSKRCTNSESQFSKSSPKKMMSPKRNKKFSFSNHSSNDLMNKKNHKDQITILNSINENSEENNTYKSMNSFSQCSIETNNKNDNNTATANNNKNDISNTNCTSKFIREKSSLSTYNNLNVNTCDCSTIEESINEVCPHVHVSDQIEVKTIHYENMSDSPNSEMKHNSTSYTNNERTSASFFSPAFSSLVNPIDESKSMPSFSLPPSYTPSTEENIKKSLEYKEKRDKGISYCFDCIRFIFMILTIYAICKLNVSYLYHYIKSQTHFKLFYIIMFTDILISLLSKLEHEFLNSIYLDLKTVFGENNVYQSSYFPSILSRASVFLQVLFDFIFGALNEILLGIDFYCYFMCICIMLGNQDDTFFSYCFISNFKDIRKQVFKKTDEVSLFYVSIRDVLTRFYMMISLCLSLLLYLKNEDDINNYLETILTVYVVEMIADWIKHAFTDKQNNISPSIYVNYSVLFNRDFIASYIDNYFDPTHMISDRMGFGLVAITSYILAVLYQNLPVLNPFIYILIFVNLVLFELLLSSMLLLASYHNHKPISITNIFNQPINVNQLMTTLK